MTKHIKLAKPLALCVAALLVVALVTYNRQSKPVEKEEDETSERALYVKDRLEFEFDLMKNPTTGKIPEDAFTRERKEALGVKWRELQNDITQWQANTYKIKGPTNLGGRSRSVVYDIRYGTGGNQVLLAGGVSSGIFRTTDGGQNWTNVTPGSFIHNVTCIAQDPRPGFQDTWYYGTGEGLGNSASATGATYVGNGVYKSIDNGLTWARLSGFSTDDINFNSTRDLVSRVAVNPANGDVYTCGAGAIARSQDGGSTWETVLGITSGSITSSYKTDIAITPAGRVYAAVGGNVRDNTFDGIWTSATGNSGSFTRIANSASVAGWNSFGNYGRIVLALAPSNPKVLYALYDNDITHSAGNPVPEADFFKYTRNDADTDGAWEDRSANLPDEVGYSAGNDPFACQGGYDLAVAVYPTNENFVFIGGTNAYRSTDGFATKSGTRFGGYVSPAGYSQFQNHHADSHWFMFNPSNPNELVTGTDGGISFLTNPLFSQQWQARNNGFVTYQYYYGAIEQVAGSEIVIGGAQDNGNTYSLSGSTTFNDYGNGGDGVSVGIAPGFYFYGTQNGSMRREIRAVNGTPTGASSSIVPQGSIGSSLFVTLFHLDRSNPNHLYYARTNRIWRTRNANTTTTAHADNEWRQLVGIPLVNSGANSRIRCIKASHGAYNAATSVLYFGNEGGQVWRLDDPAGDDTTKVPVAIAGNQLPVGVVIDIAVHPKHPEKVLAVLSNYGIENIWYCDDTKAANPAWIMVEGNLTEQSVRSAAIVSWDDNGTERTEYYVGTSTGLYSHRGSNNGASPIAASPEWLKEGAGIINNAIVREIDVRHSDNTLLIVTHGNGMFLAQVNQDVLPLNLLHFAAKDMGKSVDLQWTASDITAFDRFDIERTTSLDEKYRPIGTVSRASYAGTESFQFADNQVNGLTQLYYRLKMIDKDGRVNYSKTVAIVRNAGADAVSVYPTISKGNFSIIVPQVVNGNKLTATVLDMQGRKLWRQQLSNGATAVTLAGQSAGMYLVQLTDESGKVLRTTKIMIQ